MRELKWTEANGPLVSRDPAETKQSTVENNDSWWD